MVKENYNIVISGVGGQGLITMTQIIAEAALIEGYDVKTSELHGLSQRGGSVETHIRFGKKVYSPLVPAKKANLILGLEILEGLRALKHADKETILLVNEFSFQGALPEKEVKEKLHTLVKKNKLYLLPASAICQEKLGKEVVAGIYLLGFAIFKGLLPLKTSSVLKAILKTVPRKYLGLNRKAFNLPRV